MNPAGSTSDDKSDSARSQERLIEGIGVAPGIAIGRAVLYTRASAEVEEQTVDEEAVEAEVKLFEEAVGRAEHDLNKVIAVTSEKLGEDSVAIFEAQRMMLHDEELLQPVRRRIREQRQNAGFAVKKVMTQHRRRLEASDNEYLRERVGDLIDVQDRIIRYLRRSKLTTKVCEDAIIVAEKLGASDIIRFKQRGVLGCVSEHGGATSHVSIIARAMNLPAVTGAREVTAHVSDGAPVVLDGHQGRIIVHPSTETLEFYRERQARYEQLMQKQQHLIPLPSETQDGHRITLQANIEFKQELELLDQYGAEGIGLLRTEMLFLMRRDISLSEEEQFESYKEFVETVGPHVTTFRLLDLGGDKMLPLAHREHNPFLGWRGIRVLLDRPELLRPQVRAILRASAYGPARILLPMITHLEEVRRFKAIMEDIKTDLRARNKAFDDVPVGIMVEVPAVALQADLFAQEVDFFSIGTNDLTQYVLAIDRGNDLVANQYDTMHPAVLSLIGRTIEAGHRHDVPVSLCGKVGADPEAVPVLAGLGIDTISASPTFLPAVKRVIRALCQPDAEALARQAVQAPDAQTVRTLIDDWFQEHAPDARPLKMPNGWSSGSTAPQNGQHAEMDERSIS